MTIIAKDRVQRAVNFCDTASNMIKSGWVYLGEFDASSNRWIARYFNFSSDAQPKTLVKERIRVLASAVNVRSDMPDSYAQFAPVVDALGKGTSIYVAEVKPWQTTGFIWARVDYNLNSP